MRSFRGNLMIILFTVLFLLMPTFDVQGMSDKKLVGVNKVKEKICLNEKEVFTQCTFKELIEEQSQNGDSFILVRVRTKKRGDGDQKTKKFIHYFDGYSFNEMLFKDELLRKCGVSQKKRFPGGSFVNMFVGDKIKFAQETKDFEISEFENFKPLFEKLFEISKSEKGKF